LPSPDVITPTVSGRKYEVQKQGAAGRQYAGRFDRGVIASQRNDGDRRRTITRAACAIVS
jgi:hypothetical protein